MMVWGSREVQGLELPVRGQGAKWPRPSVKLTIVCRFKLSGSSWMVAEPPEADGPGSRSRLCTVLFPGSVDAVQELSDLTRSG